jgi:hypothetical protein
MIGRQHLQNTCKKRSLILLAAVVVQVLAAHQQVDVVTLAQQPSCVTTHALSRLNQHIPGIRRIHLITSKLEFCDRFTKGATNVECYMESSFLTGITKESIEMYMSRRFPGDDDVSRMSRRAAKRRSGWYLQQILKLGAATAISKLTEYYVIWDLDCMPLQPIPLFADNIDTAHEGFVARADISNLVFPSYAHSYKHLFGRDVEYPKPAFSFVAHWMLVYKPHLLDMLREIGMRGEPAVGQTTKSLATKSGTLPASWAWKVLDSVPSSYKGVFFGLSEYTMYISWVIQNRPGSIKPESEKRFVRVAPGSSTWLQERQHFACCPDDAILQKALNENMLYLGWELGPTHAGNCSESLFGNHGL